MAGAEFEFLLHMTSNVKNTTLKQVGRSLIIFLRTTALLRALRQYYSDGQSQFRFGTGQRR